MASGRINYDEDTDLGSDIRQVMRTGVAFRKGLEELDRKLARYNDANADIATDAGIASGSVQTVRDLVARAAGEMAGVAIVAVAQDAQTQTRTLLDSMG